MNSESDNSHSKLTRPAITEPKTRPAISGYCEPRLFIRDMLEYRKASDAKFSVLSATKSLRRLSPTLVTLIIQGKRKVTLDRVDELASLLKLSFSEKTLFKNWVWEQSNPTEEIAIKQKDESKLRRKEASVHLLNDWLNVFVKDCFQIAKIQENPALVYEYLAPIASRRRIEKSLNFLLKEGYLRTTLENKIVVDVDLAVVNPDIPNKKIRDFHKAALRNAQNAIDIFPKEERLANTVLMPLDMTSYQELLELIKEFGTQVQDLAENRAKSGDRLYQLIVNLSPTGGQQK